MVEKLINTQLEIVEQNYEIHFCILLDDNQAQEVTKCLIQTLNKQLATLMHNTNIVFKI